MRNAACSSGLFALLALFGLFEGSVLCGCPGSLEDPARFTGASGVSGTDVPPRDIKDCPDVPTTIFEKSCTNPGCHNAQDRTQGLDLQSADVATRLRARQASGGAGLLIDSDFPKRSVLYTKVTSQPPYGARMPLTGPLDEGSIACVLAWVTAGDAPDAGPDDADADDASGDAPRDASPSD